MADERILIAGLGNPGAKYAKTRHNAGFMVIDHFAADIGGMVVTEKMQGLHKLVRILGKSVILLKPQTFMNRSGECIVRYCRYFDIQPKNILVVHDDLDLNSGRIRMVPGGGAGGHKGILSIIRHLGTDEFCRTKIGIGRPSHSETGTGPTVEKYVLSKFTGEQWQLFEKNRSVAAEGIRIFIDRGINAAMNWINAPNKADRTD